MEEWQKHQKHTEDIREILTETGCMRNGQIRAWSRKASTKMDEKGHSSLDFHKCSCRNRNEKHA